MESFRNKFEPILSKSKSCSYLQFVDGLAYIGFKTDKSKFFKKIMFLMEELEYHNKIKMDFCEYDILMTIKFLEPIEDKKFEIEI
jgi:hypothetical protein